jgi:hypothetical protein
MKVSDKSKLLYLLLMIIFLLGVGGFWLDYIGLIKMDRIFPFLASKESQSVLYAGDDEPSLMKLEEFEKEKDKLKERIADLDRREAMLGENEKRQLSDKDKIEEMRKGIELEKKRLNDEKNKNNGYKKNVADLAGKIQSMLPAEAVQIMVKWDDPLIIDVLRQIDENALAEGSQSVSSYLISLMPKDKASRVMYLMTQL